MLIADGSEAKIHRDIFDVGGRYEEGFSVGVLTGGSDLPYISDTAFSLSLSLELLKIGAFGFISSC